MVYRTHLVGFCTILIASILLVHALLYPGQPWVPFIISDPLQAGASAADPSSFDEVWPRKIWQTWRVSVSGMEENVRRYVATWNQKNTGYRYEMFTDDGARSYVRDKYRERSDIVDLYMRIEEPVLRADYFRYLALLAEGGVYSDIDTECIRPIDDWIPAHHRNQTSLIVGIEYDAMDGEIRGDFDLKVQLCQWTFAARPGNSALRNVVERVTKALQEYSIGNPTMVVDQEHGGNIFYLTGPRIFTVAILEAMSTQIGRKVAEEEIMNLKGPKLIGDVLVMPISAFGSGQDHSGAKDWGNDEQLIAHHFAGFKTWKPSHMKEGKTWI